MADNENLNTEVVEPVEPVEVVHDLSFGKSLLGATLGATATEQEPDEEFETIPVAELVEVKLGRQGENNTQTVVIDCSAWLAKLPGCTFMIAATRPGEREIYLPEVSVSSGVVTWPIMEQDTACAGAGRAEVRAMLNGKVKKSALFRTRVEPALEGDGSPDAPTPPNWVRLIIGSVEASQAAAEHAESLIDEATACAINAVRFDESQGLTEAQKATGRGNIDSVGLKQGAANAGKVLLVGSDGNVTLGDAVQIDATLQQAGQAADAAAAGAALQGKVAIAQGSRNAGKALVVGQDGNVMLGEAGIPDAVKSALMACFAKVAWSVDQGQTYYNALYAALYNASPEPTPPTPTDDYITSGLLAFWDGIDNTGSGHNGSATKWTDKVNSHELTISGQGTTWGENCINFTGNSGQQVTGDQLWSTMPDNLTLECVFAITQTPFRTNQPVVGLGATIALDDGSGYLNGHRIVVKNDQTVIFEAKITNAFLLPSGITPTTIYKAAATYSGNEVVRAYVNGTEVSRGTTQQGLRYEATDKTVRVGNNGVYGEMPVTGKVYAIRVYNRQLSASELAHNDALDVERYGLE